MLTCDIFAQIFLDKCQLSCKDLIGPKFYFALYEKIGKRNEYHIQSVTGYFLDVLQQKDVNSEEEVTNETSFGYNTCQ